MPQSKSKILIADDNVANVELLQAYLCDVDCHVVIATDGQETLEQVVLHRPDLILLDVMMPKLSGFEICEKLKSDPETSGIMILMVTALNESGDIERAVQAGTDDFLSKPVNKLELLTRVKSLLRVRHLKRELDRTEAYIRDLEQARQNQG